MMKMHNTHMSRPLVGGEEKYNAFPPRQVGVPRNSALDYKLPKKDVKIQLKKQIKMKLIKKPSSR